MSQRGRRAPLVKNAGTDSRPRHLRVVHRRQQRARRGALMSSTVQSLLVTIALVLALVGTATVATPA